MRIAAFLIIGTLMPFALPGQVELKKLPAYKVEFDIRDTAAGKSGLGKHYSILTDGSQRTVF